MDYYAVVDKRTVTIPDIIEFVDENNQDTVNVTNGIRSVTIPSQITLTARNGITITESTPNNFTIRTSGGGGGFVIGTFTVGPALMGESAHGGYAVFCHKYLNTERDYALIQPSGNNYTYLNCRNGGQILLRQNNNNRMILRDDGVYNTLELHPSSSSESYKVRMRHGNGNYWDMIAPAKKFIFNIRIQINVLYLLMGPLERI